MPLASPTVIMGMGGMGRRVARRVDERLAEDPVAAAGGVRVLEPADGTALRRMLREAALALTDQRVVSRLEAKSAIRRPAGRYLRLTLIGVAALAEVEADLLAAFLQAAADLDHPAPGLEVLLVLDATDPEDGNAVSLRAPVALETLQTEESRLRARCRERWSAVPAARVYLAHPHRMDGSRLDHTNLLAPPPKTGEPEEAGHSPLRAQKAKAKEEPEAGAAAPDDFEATLAGALAGHVAAGPQHGGLAAEVPDPGEPPFALLGWSADLFPRERLLQRAGAFLAADVLARSAEPEREQTSAERMLPVEGGEEAWKQWLRTRDEILLDPVRLLRRLLSPGVEENRIEAGPPALLPMRKSLYRQMLDRYFGDREETSSAAGALRVRLRLSAGSWSGGDPRRWPDEMRALDARGAQEFDAALALLLARDVAQQAAEEVALALARCADLCVRRHLGGAQAAAQFLDDAARTAEAGARKVAAVRFAEPQPDPSLGLPSGAGLETAWQAFQDRCARLPGWPAALMRGGALGALVTTGGMAFGWPVWLLAALGAGALALSVAAYGVWLGRLKRLRDYVQECLCAKYGRRLFEFAQRAAGTGKISGVYPAVAAHIRQEALPAVHRFEQARCDLIAQARQNPPFPREEGATETLAEAEQAADLHTLLREDIDDAALADDARDLLRAEDLYKDWRDPAPERMLAQTAAFTRRHHLFPWEAGQRTLGDFLRALHAHHHAGAAQESAFAEWVARRVDRLAQRAV
ncbi:MAG TPA: hypothetical protein VKT32_15010, partial [Chthonomonadaceae bacterium]|nr:hypothetical protein [Chthonomonadaceae bacterium]